MTQELSKKCNSLNPADAGAIWSHGGTLKVSAG